MPNDILDWAFKLIGSLLGAVAIFQLYETRKRRLVEMYWKIADQYLSEETHKRRLAVHKVETWRVEQKADIGPSGSTKLAEAYRKMFHDAEGGTESKQIDIDARHHVRFLNQVGVLSRKRVVDRDLTFGLIGAGMEIDYPALRVILEAHRTAHNIDKMYSDFDYLWERYEEWRAR